MSKQNVISTLGIDPYEIYHGIEAGCEIHTSSTSTKKNTGTLNSFEKCWRSRQICEAVKSLCVLQR